MWWHTQVQGERQTSAALVSSSGGYVCLRRSDSGPLAIPPLLCSLWWSLPRGPRALPFLYHWAVPECTAWGFITDRDQQGVNQTYHSVLNDAQPPPRHSFTFCFQVGFKLFGIIPGFVGLRGTVEPVGDNDDTVKVFFEPPILSIANNLHIRIGEALQDTI